MRMLYSLSIVSYGLLIRIVSLFNKKAKQWIKGRQNVFQEIEGDLRHNKSPLVWFHAASLGEFEQGRPVIESFKKQFPECKILLTFFSPSGYEVQKNYSGADFIYYLPLDTRKNAKRFVSIVKPKTAFFIKYEFWRNYFEVLREADIPLISFSTIFRKDQVYFKRDGFNRATLKLVDYFFVQNHLSGDLLNTIGLQNWEKAGDTRFDRVLALRTQRQDFEEIEQFKGESKLFVVGSSWKEDLDVLLDYINKGDVKFLIAPHEINISEIKKFQEQLRCHSVLFSELSELKAETKVVIVDSIGKLSSLYQYADFAFIGGAYRTGLHNVLEPATYGVPLFFGPKYQKFQEAVDLIERKGAFCVTSSNEFQSQVNRLLNDDELYSKTVDTTQNYVTENVGATDKIIGYCRKMKL